MTANSPCLVNSVAPLILRHFISVGSDGLIAARDARMLNSASPFGHIPS